LKPRYIRKCECCNKRLKRIVTYECRTDDCEAYSYEGIALSDIETDKIPSDIWLEEEEGEH